MQFRFNLKAGVPAFQETPGRLFVLEDTGAASSIKVVLYNGSEEIETLDTVQRGFSARMLDAAGFTRVQLTSTVDTAAKIIISRQNLSLDFLTGAQVSANIIGLPLPVSNDRGSPGNLLYVSGVSVADAPALAVGDLAPVAVTAALTAIAAADATRREVRFLNNGANPVAIGGAGLTWAKRVIVLGPGDLYIETRGSNLAWSALCDAGLATTINVQTVTA